MQAASSRQAAAQARRAQPGAKRRPARAKAQGAAGRTTGEGGRVVQQNQDCTLLTDTDAGTGIDTGTGTGTGTGTASAPRTRLLRIGTTILIQIPPLDRFLVWALVVCVRNEVIVVVRIHAPIFILEAVDVLWKSGALVL